MLSLPTLQHRATQVSPAESQLHCLNRLPLPAFSEKLSKSSLWPLKPLQPQVLQLNLGKLCNQTCRHCHVDAGPDRTEVMSEETMSHCIRALAASSIPTVDITGGAPELVPGYRWLVSECRALKRHVMTRCNLTLIETRKHQDLPEFFAEQGVEVIASLPHYRALNTDRQRGDGVFEKSISALRRLNDVGYGTPGSGLRLVLVTNPAGAYLPGPEASLELEWKEAMQRLHGIRFDALFTITNMPIARYLQWLVESDNLESYMAHLVNAFNPRAAAGVMCRTTLNVGWDGTLYDCDFNQMLEMPVDSKGSAHVRDFSLESLSERSIRVAPHCFGCTAGGGSSCGGSTT